MRQSSARLIAAFYPACVKEITTVNGTSDDVPFRARGVRVVDPGWTVLYPARRTTRRRTRSRTCPSSGSARPARTSRSSAGRDDAAEAVHRG